MGMVFLHESGNGGVAHSPSEERPW
jgi:hypothetical protein